MAGEHVLARQYGGGAMVVKVGEVGVDDVNIVVVVVFERGT